MIALKIATVTVGLFSVICNSVCQ